MKYDYYILIHKITCRTINRLKKMLRIRKKSHEPKKNETNADFLPETFLTQAIDETCVKKPNRRLFSIVAHGSSWTEELVFTVLAENDVWAEELVRQWLNSNGKEHYKIDKVQAILSRNVRAIVNVGAKLDGTSRTDELVFTVMAENNVLAEEMVRQWLNSNERENYKIDKVRGIVSQDLRAIVNVGAKLLDV